MAAARIVGAWILSIDLFTFPMSQSLFAFDDARIVGDPGSGLKLSPLDMMRLGRKRCNLLLLFFPRRSTLFVRQNPPNWFSPP